MTKELNKQPKRFQYRFTNGFWKVFDTEEYTDVEIHFLKKEAIAATKKLNG